MVPPGNWQKQTQIISGGILIQARPQRIPTDKVPEIKQSTQECHEIHSKKKRYHE